MSISGELRLRSVTGQDPSDYAPHPLHAPARTYRESNCYTDIVIELVHARGLEPLAVLGHLVAIDFEGDQWTFFKPPPEDIELLYGIDIHEMQPYRSLPLQIAEQIEAGRTMIVELDSWHLPDTAGTSYRTAHVKSSVAVDAIDPEAEVMRYFHGPGLFELSGEDYRGVWRIGAPPAATLPPYTEIVRFDAATPLDGAELREAALGILRRHLGRRPRTNPFLRFGTQLRRALPGLLEGELDDYHAYAFATVRIAGSAFELAADHARWLFDEPAEDVTAPMSEIVDACKALSFRLARRRPFDPEPAIENLAAAWTRAMSALVIRAG
jgi:hypothetical protein